MQACDSVTLVFGAVELYLPDLSSKVLLFIYSCFFCTECWLNLSGPHGPLEQ